MGMKKILGIGAAVLGGLIVVSVVANSGGGSTSAPVARPATATAAPAGPAFTYTPAPAPARVTTPAAAPEPTGITEGTYEVGADVAPGKYKTAGPDSGSGHCYYARLKNSDGFNIIDNDLKEGPMSVTIKASDYEFETNGCQPWIKVG